jgi:protein-disulfide isomerase
MNFLTPALASLGVLAALGTAYVSSRPADARLPAPASNRAVEKVVRNYILENPEILPEAMMRLQEKESRRLLGSLRSELETPFHGAVGGNPRGNVTLVVFFDFRCPYCHHAKAEVDKLIQSDSQLRVVYRDYPILDSPGSAPISRLAASLALAAAKQNKYVAFHDALFAAPAPMTQEVLVRAARMAQLAEQEAVAASASKDVAEAINRNIEIGRLLNISGTPAYVLGNKVLIGGDKVAELPQLIAKLRG